MESQLFPANTGYSAEMYVFRSSQLGCIQSLIPFDKLLPLFTPHLADGRQGRKGWLDVKGGLALMFLKAYSGCASDADLVERLNSDYHFQLFCGIRIPIGCSIKDKDLPGRWRRFFAKYMDIQALQKILANAWQPHMENISVQMDDATCYESEVRYPTDVKLLYECCEWLHKQWLELSKAANLPKPHDHKIRKAFKRYGVYARMRRKSRKKRRSLLRSLLYWLETLVKRVQWLLNKYPQVNKKLNNKFYKKLKTIRIVGVQQRYMYEHNVRKYPNRIVSLAKPYLRPIVRGKERKKVEFGAKGHTTQVDGINFIEHLDFENFHEGNRMWNSIAQNKHRFGKLPKQYAGDKIYATNKNRRKARKLGIATCFKRKGRKAKDEKQRQKMRDILNKERATRLEGSFGTEKNRYLNGRVRAKREDTEKAWIFFAVHTANLVRLAKRLLKKNKSIKPSG